MKILHTADVHACASRWSEVEASLSALEAHARADRPSLIVISGDLADGPIANTERDVLAALGRRLVSLASVAPVALIYGTPTHDAPGSLEIFESLTAAHPIRILRPGRPYYLTSLGDIMDGAPEWTRYEEERAIALLFGVPEPSKKWLLAEAGAMGKDEADQAARSAIRNLFLGLGGMRGQHPDLPCILLYHGQVAGAKSGTGFQAEAGQGLVASLDDLAAVGADYIALGDIHEPQQVGALPAYYPGSCYPINWGETHQAGFNEVTIKAEATEGDLFTPASGGISVSVERVTYPQPQRMKISEDLHAINLSLGLPKKPLLLWYEVDCTKEEAASLDPAALSAQIVAMGALPGSRVTLNVRPTETVRAAEISTKRSLHDKLLVYGEASGLSVPASVLSKADELEASTAGAGPAGHGAHFRIDRLVLRGAIGIWKKSGKDEIDLDLSSYGAGVLALVGSNGAGKTTILENLHPWPQMLTRDGRLKDHFRLKDSCRDLYLTDERTGTRYRALITIRADIDSGAAEYHLFRDQGAGFTPYPGITGRLDDYASAVAAVFGSLELYLRTAFATQRPTKAAPDLAQATPGQRKALFGELAGIDYLDAYRVAAKAQGDTLDGEVLRLDATIAAGEGLDEVIQQARTDLEDADKAGREADAAAAASAERGKSLVAQRDEVAATLDRLRKTKDRLAVIGAEISAARGAKASAEAAIRTAREAAAKQDEAAAALAEIQAMEAERAALMEEQAQAHKEAQEALRKHSQALGDVQASRRAAQATLDKAQATKARAERDLAAAEARLSAPIADHCPTCGQALPEDRQASLRAEREAMEANVAALASARADAELAVQLARSALESITDPAKPEIPAWAGAARLSEIDGILAWSDRPALEQALRLAQDAAVRIEDAERRSAEAGAIIAAREAEERLLRQEIQPGEIEAAALILSERVRQLDAEREVYTQARAAMEGAKQRVIAARVRIDDTEKRIHARELAQKTRSMKAAELADWRFLEGACGPNGIQALELDALSPSIAAVSNRLLSEAYGSRYQIEFHTTRIAGKGSKTKQVEDFEIVVRDTETGTEQAMDSLSGGEAVWIRKALYDGFSVIRAQNQGLAFQTVFLDEADGALDPEARMLYLRMLEAAHREAGRFQTILITHSTEIQASVGTVIDVSTLEGRREGRDEAAA